MPTLKELAAMPPAEQVPAGGTLAELASLPPAQDAPVQMTEVPRGGGGATGDFSGATGEWEQPPPVSISGEFGKGLVRGTGQLAETVGGTLPDVAVNTAMDVANAANRGAVASTVRGLQAQGALPPTAPGANPADMAPVLAPDPNQPTMRQMAREVYKPMQEGFQPDSRLDQVSIKPTEILSSPGTVREKVAKVAGGVGETIPSQTPTVAAFMAGGPVAAGLVGGSLEAAQEYDTAILEGKPHSTALRRAAIVGGGTSALNALPFAAAMSKYLPAGKVGVALRIIAGAGTEGATETLEGGIPPIARLQTLPKSKEEAIKLWEEITQGVYNESDVFIPAAITGGASVVPEAIHQSMPRDAAQPVTIPGIAPEPVGTVPEAPPAEPGTPIVIPPATETPAAAPVEAAQQPQAAMPAVAPPAPVEAPAPVQEPVKGSLAELASLPPAAPPVAPQAAPVDPAVQQYMTDPRLNLDAEIPAAVAEAVRPNARTKTLETAAQNMAAIEGKAEPVIEPGQGKAFDRLVEPKAAEPPVLGEIPDTPPAPQERGWIGETRRRMQEQQATPEAPQEAAQAPTVTPAEPSDTISGKMNLDEFEAKGYDPSEVTQAEWIDMQRKARRGMGQREESGTPAAPFSDYEEYHRSRVEEAVRQYIEKPGPSTEVDDRVLADYPDLAERYNASVNSPQPEETTPQKIAEEVATRYEIGAKIKFRGGDSYLIDQRVDDNGVRTELWSGLNGANVRMVDEDSQRVISAGHHFPGGVDAAKSKYPIFNQKSDGQENVQLQEPAPQPVAQDLSTPPAENVPQNVQQDGQAAADATPPEIARRDQAPPRMFEPGAKPKTLTGRETTAFPKVNTATERTIRSTMKRVDEWFRHNAILEAKARGDEFNADAFSYANPSALTPAERESMNMYLFEQQPEVVKSILKPMGAEPAATPPVKDEGNATNNDVPQQREVGPVVASPGPLGGNGTESPGVAVEQPAGTGVRARSSRGPSGIRSRRADGAKPADGSTGSPGASDTGNLDAPAGGEAVNAPERDGAEEAVPVQEAGRGGSRKPVKRNDRNHRIEPEDVIVPPGQKSKIAANIKAMETLKKIETEGRDATPEERKILARYTGWGHSPQVFDKNKAQAADRNYSWNRDENWEKKYLEDYRAVEGMLTTEEWNAARESTINAHYTSRGIIEKMWKAVERLGFNGGRILEPAAGAGHFLGLTPEKFRNSPMIAVELDATSARLLKALYPDADTFAQGFESTKIPRNTVKLVITNVPFAKTGPNDPAHPNLNLHNYFFAKGFDTLAPGGVMAAITTHYTMDSNIEQRRYLGSRAKLVGAIRLPSNAFKENAGTEVTTDILFFQKPFNELDTAGEAWTNTVNVGTDEAPIMVNEYFANNPEMVLGEHSMEGSMYRGGNTEYTLKARPDADLADLLEAAIERLPENIMRGVQEQEFDFRALGTAQGMKDGSLHERDGHIVMVEDGEFVAPPLKGDAEISRARDFIGVRDEYRKHLDLMNHPDTGDAEFNASLKSLNKVYDAYVKKHGYINEPKTKKMQFDPGFYLLAGTEKKVIVTNPKTGKREDHWAKGDVYSVRTVRPTLPPSQAGDLADALNISMAYKGIVNPDYIAELTGTDREQVIDDLKEKGLIFENPATGFLETPDRYLSGNVRDKLRIAEDAGRGYERNVEALKAAQPKRVPLKEISKRLGATWIPDTVINKFQRDTFRAAGMVRYSQQTDRWIVQRGASTPEVETIYGTPDMDAYDLLERLLNMKDIKVYDTIRYPDGSTKRVFNPNASIAARAKGEQIEKAFQKFITDDKIGKLLEDTYNEVRNFYVDPSFDGSHLVLPGKSDTVELRPYQKNVIWRIIQEGRGMMAHAVGAGKTFSIIGAVMESRRLGIAKKPMVVVQNSTLLQYASAFQTMYPGANVLVAGKDELKTGNRKRFLAHIAASDYDAVIISQSQFDLLPSDPATEEKVLQGMISQLETAEAEMREQLGKNDPTVKDIAKSVKRLRERLDKTRSKMKAKQDDVIHFEQLGIDMLVVDEAHIYKKPPFVTKLENVAGLNKTASEVATNLFFKVTHIQEKRAGRGIVLATGTPVTNTLGEAWHMLNLTSPDILKEFQADTFDRFVSGFAIVKPEFTQNAGGKWVVKNTLSSFTNGPELIKMIRSSWDVLMKDELDSYMLQAAHDMPALRNGAPTIVKVPLTEPVRKFLELLERVYTKYSKLTGEQKKANSAIPLMLYNANRTAALDIRMIDPEAKDDPGSKVNMMVSKVAEIHKATKKDASTQLVFVDTFNQLDTTKLHAFARGEQVSASEDEIADLDEVEDTNDEASEKNASEIERKGFLINDIVEKLVAAGVPRNEIARMADASTDAKKQALFDKVNAGEVRVLVGGTKRMGIGVNVQKKLIALHHLDAPWMPADLEQREGRILRYGNENKEVDIFSYGMEGTLDSAIYSKILYKSKFIRQVLSGRTSEREFDDPSSAAILSFEEMMAAFSGDPRIFQKIQLQNRLKELEVEREAFQEQQRRQRGMIKPLEGDIARAEARAKKYQAALDSMGAITDRTYQVKIDGKVYDKDTLKKGFEEPIAAAIEAASNDPVPFSVTLGTFSSQPMAEYTVLTGNIEGTNITFTAQAVARETADKRGVDPVHYTVLFEQDGGVIGRSEAKTGQTLLNAINALPSRLEGDIKREERDIERHREDIVQIKEALGRDWDKQQQYDTVKSELSDLDADLTKGDEKPEGEAAAGEDSGESEYAPDGGRAPLPKGNGSTAEVVRMTEIVRELDKVLAPIRKGRLRRRVALGVFKEKPEVIRSRVRNDIQAIAHEVGHQVQKIMFPLRDRAGNVLPTERLTNRQIPRAFRAELEAMAYQGAPKDKAAVEGYAEFVRLWIVDQASAASQAPGFFQEFEAQLKKHPDLERVMRSTQTSVTAWLNQPEALMVESTISRDPQDGRKGVGSKLENLFRQVFDDMRPQQRGVKEITGGKGVAAADDPYKTSRLYRGVAGKAQAWIENGVTDANGKKVGKSLKAVLAPVQDDMEGFSRFIVSQHALERIRKGMTMPLEASKYRAVVNAAPQLYRDVSQELTEYQDALLNHLVEAGLISDEGRDAMHKKWKHYVPLYRVHNAGANEEGSGGKGDGGGFANQANPVKRAKGGGEDMIDPIESIVKHTFLFTAAAERNKVMTQWANLADQNIASGRLVERVTPNIQQVATVSLADLLTAEEAEDLGIPMDVLESTVRNIFRAVPQASARENIVTFWEDGKVHLLQMDKELYDTVLNMDTVSENLFLQLLSLPARTLRAGATLTPEFSGRNIIRDAWTGLMQSDYGMKPWHIVRGLFHVLRRDDLYHKWLDAGGAHAAFVSGDRNYFREEMARLTDKSLPKRTIDVVLHPIDTLRALSEVMEAPTRLAEFGLGTDWGKETNASKVIDAALASRDVTVDFSRQGKSAREYNRLTAFFTASIGGNLRAVETMMQHPARTMTRGVAYITLPTLLLYLLNRDDEDYKKIPEWQKDTCWFIPIGTGKDKFFIRLPKAHIFGFIFGTVPERVLRWIDQEDPHAFDDMGKTLQQQTVPPLIPTALTPLFQIASNTSFTGAPIIPRREQDLAPKDQVGAQTTSIAVGGADALRAVTGGAVDLSPRQVDYAIQGYSGGLGSMAVKAADAVTGGKGEGRAKFLTETPILRAFVGNPWTSSVNVSRMYEELVPMDQRVRAKEKLSKEENRRHAILSNGAARLSELRKRTRAIEESKDYTPVQKRDAMYAIKVTEDEIARAVVEAPDADTATRESMAAIRQMRKTMATIKKP